MHNCVQLGGLTLSFGFPDPTPRKASAQIAKNTLIGSCFLTATLFTSQDLTPPLKQLELDVSENIIEHKNVVSCSQDPRFLERSPYLSEEQVRGLLPKLIGWREKSNVYQSRQPCKRCKRWTRSRTGRSFGARRTPNRS
jgi:hypothetical protein